MFDVIPRESISRTLQHSNICTDPPRSFTFYPPVKRQALSPVQSIANLGRMQTCLAVLLLLASSLASPMHQDSSVLGFLLRCGYLTPLEDNGLGQGDFKVARLGGGLGSLMSLMALLSLLLLLVLLSLLLTLSQVSLLLHLSLLSILQT